METTADMQAPRVSGRSLLLDLPNELFYQVLWYTKDLADLASLATIPSLSRRMRRFVQVHTGKEELFHTPQIFHDFPRFDLREPAAEYTINLVEIDQTTKITRDLFNELYVRFRNVRNYIMVMGMIALRRTDSQSLEWIWPEVTVVEVETIRREFNLRCILVLTEETFSFENCAFSSSSGQIIGKKVNQFTLINVTVLGTCDRLNGVCPTVLNIDDSSANWIQAIDYPHAEHLHINHKLPRINSVLSYTPKKGFSPLAINFHNIEFTHMRTLQLDNVNCMKNTSFPVLESLKMTITGQTKNGNILVVPLIQDLDAPLCQCLSVEMHLVLPEVRNINMPHCQKLHARVVDIRHELPNNDPDYELDWYEYFGLSHFEVYGKTPQESTEWRALPRDVHGWPHAQDVTLTDTSHLFRNNDFLSDTSTLTMEFYNPEEESHVYIPESHGKMPLLKTFTIIDKLTLPHAKSADIFCPQYRLEAYNLEELHVCRSPHSKMYLNYENMVDNFPKLRSLHVYFCNHLDKFPDRAILRNLTSLVLEKYDLDEVMSLLTCLRERNLETVILGRTVRSRVVDLDPSLPREICDTLTRCFSETLSVAIIDFDDLLVGQMGVSKIFLRGMKVLKELGVGGIGELIIKDCPLLSMVQVRVGEEWHAAACSNLEKLHEGEYRLNVSEVVEEVRERDGPFSTWASNTASHSSKRKASTIISGTTPVRTRCDR